MKQIIPVILTFFWINSNACDCARIKDLEAFQRESYLTSELIFIGELAKSNDDGSYEFRIIELFKGDVPDSIVAGEYQTICSAFPDTGEHFWLVYSNPNAKGIIDINSCGLSRSFEFPFLMNEQATVPPPPERQSNDPTLALVEHFKLMSEYKSRALAVLEHEIEQLRKWREE
ncbi:MAG: hypothetical protein RLN88_00030 [Ekhidna sp.]|uniref:hypothetical protein n=1 Tax=Ekhidna sp. TaxID=2608089 RepID=UPI0032EFE1FE